MRDDLRAAVRSLRSARGFTVVALFVLTLGIGATTAIFSVVDAVVLRGLPFEDSGRLVAVGEKRRGASPTARSGAVGLHPVAPQNYLDWVARQQVFDAIAAVADGELTFRRPGGEPMPLVAMRVTADFFPVLRVTPAIGAGFAAGNEEAGRHRVVVLSHAFWRQHLGADSQIVGRTIQLDDVERRSGPEDGAYVVTGVMPSAFNYPVGAAEPTDVWVPYVVPSNERMRDPARRHNYLQVLARLESGVTLTQAQAQMDRIAASIELANPEWNKDSGIGLTPLVNHVVGGQVRSWMLLLLGAVGAVLLIACANVANLCLARAQSREREVGIRAVLGASKWRLVRQLMTESLVLSAVGTACAVVVAWWAVHVLRAAMPESVPRAATIALDLRVLIVASGLAVITGMLFGAAPSRQLSRPDLSNALKEGQRSTSSSGRRGLRAALVITEVALALVLLVGAGLFIASFRSLTRIDPGFHETRVLIGQISPPAESRRSAELTIAFEEIIQRLGRIPGVLQASMISGSAPLTTGTITRTSFFESGKLIDITFRRVSPDYHRALGIPLRAGRLFNPSDIAGAPPVVILNESAARQYFPGEDPLGRSFSRSTVVGIVGDVRHSSLESEPLTAAYQPITQRPSAAGSLVIRTAGDPYDVLPAVSAAVHSVLPDVPLRRVTTIEELVGKHVAKRRLSMLLLGLFGVLGLVIAAAGVYGVMSYLVSQRTREIGVRMALGASRSHVIRSVLMGALAMVAVGLCIGSLTAWYLSAAAQAFLFGVESTDPRALAAAATILLAASMVAAAIPAWRAATVDPVLAMRAE